MGKKLNDNQYNKVNIMGDTNKNPLLLSLTPMQMSI